jgi:hypothetical protein
MAPGKPITLNEHWFLTPVKAETRQCGNAPTCGCLFERVVSGLLCIAHAPFVAFELCFIYRGSLGGHCKF